MVALYHDGTNKYQNREGPNGYTMVIEICILMVCRHTIITSKGKGIRYIPNPNMHELMHPLIWKKTFLQDPNIKNKEFYLYPQNIKIFISYIHFPFILHKNHNIDHIDIISDTNYA